MPNWETAGETSDLKWETAPESTDPKKEESAPSSATEAFASHAAEGVFPTLTGLASWEAGASIGAAAGALTGPLAPVMAPLGALVGGLTGAFLGSSAAHAVQKEVMPEKWESALKKQEQEHPTASFAGGLTSQAAAFRPGVSSLGTMITGGGVGGAIEAGTEAARGERLDPTKIGMSAIAGAVLTKPTTIGEKVAKRAIDIATRTKEVSPILGEGTAHKFTKGSTSQDLAGEIHRVTNSRTADGYQLSKNFKTAEKSGLTPELDRKFRDVSEGSTTHSSPEEAALYEKTILPMKQETEKGLATIYGDKGKEIEGEITARIAKRYNAWTDNVDIEPGVAGAKRMGREASAMKPRSVFAREDGTIITVKKDEQGYRVTAWRDGENTLLGHSDTPIKGQGETFLGQKLTQAKQKDIETHTPIKYVDSDFHVWAQKLIEVRARIREKEFLDNLTKSEFGNAYIKNTKDIHGPETGLVPLSPEAQTAFPTLRDKSLRPEDAEVLHDYAKRSGGHGVADVASNFIIRAMMINPYPHIMNEFVHWFDARGASGFLSPTQATEASLGMRGMGFLPEAAHSVFTKDKFQMDLLREGGFLMRPTGNQLKEWEKISQLGFKDALKDARQSGSIKEIAKVLGIPPAKFLKSISDMSSDFMWATRDVLYTHLIKEQMAMGKSMKEAITEVGQHMPEYFLPSRIITDGKFGRLASKTMQHRGLVFGRYHYGLFKALSRNVREVAAILKGKEGIPEFAKGIDHTLSFAVGMGLVFKGLDVAYTSVFGTPAEERRAGPYHILSGAIKTLKGEQEYSTLLQSVLTINPAASMPIQFLTGKDWAGKPILQSESTVGKATDVAHWAGSQIGPVQAIESGVEGKQTPAGLLAKQMDVKLTSPHQEKMKERFLRKQKIQNLKHEIQRKRNYGL